jgi:O-antigen/teichoic acid export membrane protein
MAIGLIGVVTLTKLIGPENYGRYAGALGLFAYLQNLGGWGVNIYLIRGKHDETSEVYDQAFTLLAISGVGLGALSLVFARVVETWTGLEGLHVSARPLLVALPLLLAAQVALARLERALMYREVAAIELGGQLAYYATALPMAISGAIATAPFAGWAVQQITTAAAYFVVSRYRPKLRWHLPEVRTILGYGFSYSASSWVWQLRTLVNPIIVGRALGLEAVGVVALTIRVVEYLTFVKAAAWRMSLAALGRLHGDLSRIQAAISSGMMFQLLAVGPLLVIFGWAAPWIMPRLFGTGWGATLEIFPYVAVGYLTNSLFNLHSSALYTLQRNWEVTRFHLFHVALFASAAFLFVRRSGVVGYGIAELIALASYPIIHRQVATNIGSVDYRAPLIWAAALGMALFRPVLGVWSFAGLLIAAAAPVSRTALTSVLRQIVAAYRGH